jgi:hypothetical protein
MELLERWIRAILQARTELYNNWYDNGINTLERLE